jgi:hypothetical protein
VATVILVNERQGYRVCLECREPYDRSDAYDWMARHAECAASRDPQPDS